MTIYVPGIKSTEQSRHCTFFFSSGKKETNPSHRLFELLRLRMSNVCQGEAPFGAHESPCSSQFGSVVHVFLCKHNSYHSSCGKKWIEHRRSWTDQVGVFAQIGWLLCVVENRSEHVSLTLVMFDEQNENDSGECFNKLRKSESRNPARAVRATQELSRQSVH